MKFLRRLIHRWLGSSHDFDQATAVQNRYARATLLAKQLEVIQRGKR